MTAQIFHQLSAGGSAGLIPHCHDEGMDALAKERQRESNRSGSFNASIPGDHRPTTDPRNHPWNQQDGGTRLPNGTLERKIGPGRLGPSRMCNNETRPFTASRSASVPGSAEKRAERTLPCGPIDDAFSKRSEKRMRAARCSSVPSRRATASAGLSSTVSTVTEAAFEGAAQTASTLAPNWPASINATSSAAASSCAPRIGARIFL